ncbi:hypothetical protein CRUP_013955 [Coryphaenoides rupestris]|nr:hypothetical protein CRUP_013955 [Coryphaenoides rupestris]
MRMMMVALQSPGDEGVADHPAAELATREQISKETLARLAWRSRYAQDYAPSKTPAAPPPRPPPGPPPGHPPGPPLGPPRGPPPGPPLGPAPRAHLTAKQPPQTRTPRLPPAPSTVTERTPVPPLMRPPSPRTREVLYQGSSHHGTGRGLYLRRRGQKRPEEKFVFPSHLVLGVRLETGGRSAVVQNTFYSRNGVFSRPATTDLLG